MPTNAGSLLTKRKRKKMGQKIEEKVKKIISEEVKRQLLRETCSKAFLYHLDNDLGVDRNVFRPESYAFFGLFKEARDLWKAGLYEPKESESFYIKETNIGEWGWYNGEQVPIDYPFLEDEVLEEAEYRGRKVKLGKPKRGGSKKFYVYVKCGPKKTVRKISFGAKGMSLGLSDPKRRKSFVARHKCKQKKDRCKAGYWACRIGRYPALTGAKSRYTWW
jgi:hypothetical protein